MNTLVDKTLFDPDFLRKLEQLELLARKLFRGLVHGEHLTRRRGHGLEFSEYRRYQPGDDLRHIDWNIYSRLDRLFVKLYSSDEDLTLHLLLDCSASMGFGTPLKFDYARKLAAALSYIGLANLDRVGLHGFASGNGVSMPTLKSKRQVATLLPFLANLDCRGTTDFANTAHTFASQTRSPGVVVVITDLIGEDTLSAGLKQLTYAKHDVVLLHLFAEEEIDPPLDGSFNLVDAEQRDTLKLTIDAGLRQLYLSHLHSHLKSLERFCLQHGVEYLRAATAIPFEDLMLQYLRMGRQWR